jgi:hypothetical protein
VNTASGVQRAAARMVARMPGAGHTLVTLSGPRPASAPAVSSVRCERTDPRLRCPRDRCPVSSVGVRASGVNVQGQCVPRPLDGPGSPSPAAVPRQPHRRTAGVGAVAPRDPRPPCPLPESEPGARAGCRRCCQRGVGLDLVVVGGFRQRPGELASPTREQPAARESPVRKAAGWPDQRPRLRSEVIVSGPGPSRLVSENLCGWTLPRACGRSAAATCSERRPLDAGDALTCKVGGGGEGI